MEHKKQTGHICQWMALGIMIATIVVGCAIGIGLSEWRNRSNMENRNALNKEVYTQTILMARHQKIAKLFDKEFWVTQ